MKIAILGANGRVGKLLTSLIEESEHELALKIEANSDYDSIALEIKKCDGVIDFSTPQGLEKFLDEAKKHGFKVPLVSGTTGVSEKVLEKINHYTKSAPVLMESNMSLGVNILFYIVEEVSKMLGENSGFKADILDIHHVHKKDSPSGTALRLFELINKGSNLLGSVKESIESRRVGEVVGDHTVTISSSGEEIQLTHKAIDRSIFAKGALVAAQALCSKPSGLYGMRDILL